MSLEEEHSLIEELRAELLARLFHATDPDGVMSATENIRTSMETLVSLGQGSKTVTREELTRLMVGLVKVSSGVAYLNQDALAGRLSALERDFSAFGPSAPMPAAGNLVSWGVACSFCTVERPSSSSSPRRFCSKHLPLQTSLSVAGRTNMGDSIRRSSRKATRKTIPSPSCCCRRGLKGRLSFGFPYLAPRE